MEERVSRNLCLLLSLCHRLCLFDGGDVLFNRGVRQLSGLRPSEARHLPTEVSRSSSFCSLIVAGGSIEERYSVNAIDSCKGELRTSAAWQCRGGDAIVVSLTISGLTRLTNGRKRAHRAEAAGKVA